MHESPDSDATSPTPRQALLQALQALWPAAQAVNAREKWRACCGAVLGMLVAALGAQGLMLGSASDHGHAMLALWLVAPVGASAVLVFALPSSPLAQPWSVIGGNTLSALIGIACTRWVPDAALAAALAVGLAIAGMLALRCLHPPGGAAALLMVLGNVQGFGHAFSPVMLDSTLLVLAGLIYNNLTRRRWPHIQRPSPAARPDAAGSRFSQVDLDAALARRNQIMDISRDDLEDLLRQAEASAYQRTLGDLRCADIMTPEPVTVRVETPLRQAWALMRSRRVKALPVIDRQMHLVGIVTVADFMKQIDLDAHEGWGWRLRALLRPGRHAAPALQQVGQIMTRQVRVASSDRLLVDLVPVFSEGGHRHVPIIDAQRRLAGIVTQSDLIRALYRAVRN
ncbi:MAG: HPP family protein [Comamonas sp.]